MGSRMVGLSRDSWDAPVLPRKANADQSALSRGEFPADLHRYRTVFPDRWAALLRDHFNGDLRRIMFSFDVSERCARDWLAGKTGPNGSAAILAVVSIPNAAAILTGQAA